MVDESSVTSTSSSFDVELVNAAAVLPSGSPQPGTRELQKELADLKKSFNDFMQHKQPELERMREDLLNTARERDDHAAELKELKASNMLKRIADDYNFNDADYLEYVLQKNNINTEDANTVAAFMQTLKQSKPRFFNLPLKSGAGSRPDAHYAAALPAGDLKRMDALELMISNARAIN